MTHELARHICDYLWLAWLIYWLIAAANKKSTARRDSSGFRIWQLLVMIVAFNLIFSDWMINGFLGMRFIPNTNQAWITGVVLTAAGLAFAVWARVHLGRNWSGSVRISKEHELIRTGPYARVRHPIYTGLLLAALGTVLVVGRWGALLGVAVAALGLGWKARREENLLAGEFGEKFSEHCRHTGFFLPKIS